MTDCTVCGHVDYWHQTRRTDDPHQFTGAPCLCGCLHAVPTTWSAP